MTSTEERPVVEQAAGPVCYLCGRPTFDPNKRDRAWARAVFGGEQVLICPRCQEERAEWSSFLDRCDACGGTRLTAMLGQVVCRACGHVKVVEATNRRGA